MKCRFYDFVCYRPRKCNLTLQNGLFWYPVIPPVSLLLQRFQPSKKYVRALRQHFQARHRSGPVLYRSGRWVGCTKGLGAPSILTSKFKKTKKNKKNHDFSTQKWFFRLLSNFQPVTAPHISPCPEGSPSSPRASNLPSKSTLRGATGDMHHQKQ